MRMTVSDVWYGTPRTCDRAGITGRPPAAITMRSARDASASDPSVRSTAICLGPVNRAWPS